MRFGYTARAMETGALPTLLERALAGDRLHSAYLLSGPRDEARAAALAFARASVCETSSLCGTCAGCRRSGPREEIAIDGTGKRGPLYRQIGDHPDLCWLERGEDDTRVRIGQIRALQGALRLRPSEGGRRVAVIADAEWLNQESQNALLRLLEEPPPGTALVLVTTSAAGLLATVRSRCQRVKLADVPNDPLADPDAAPWVARLEGVARASMPELLDWAEEFRGARAPAAAQLEEWLQLTAAWLRRRIGARVAEGAAVRGELEAARVLSECRQALVQRNANPQMMAERALFALQAGVRG
jgi:DNA polymerase III delta prime subunit